mgnify:CR=1 FL=1
MKKTILLILLLQFGLYSCNKEKSENKITRVKSSKKSDVKNKLEFSENDYDLVYKFSNDDSNQILGINYINTKSLKFHLTTNKLPCDTEYWGIAKNDYLDFASEVDEDENGTAYGSKEYVMNKKEYTISIRVALDSSKVIIKYIQVNGIHTDCLPIADKIMNRWNKIKK